MELSPLRMAFTTSFDHRSPHKLLVTSAEAQLRNTTVQAVTAWRGPRPPAASGGRPPALSTTPDEAFALEEQRCNGGADVC